MWDEQVFLPVCLHERAVVDIETTGLDPERDKVIAAAVAAGCYLRVYRLHVHRGETDMRERIRRDILTLQKAGYRVYAWNRGFEESFLGLTGLEELMLWEREKKDRSLSWGFEPPTNGSRVPEHYGNGEYDVIVLRAVYDTLIEAASLLRGAYLEYASTRGGGLGA